MRASREGHHFHEAWAARRALELLAPKDNLVGIAVEGLSPDDQTGSDDATDEIADLVLYYGTNTNFDDCDAQVILQLKYSIAKADAPLVASDMIKTLKKFSLSEVELLKLHSGTGSMAKRFYRVVSNRPFGTHFLDAIEALRTEQKPTDDDVSSQLKQIKRVLKLNPADQANFASRLEFMGEEPDLRGLKTTVAIRMGRWSAGSDLQTEARLGGLDAMMRGKAESAGQGRNVIRRADVLSALRLEETEDLLPTPAAFPLVQAPLTRRQGVEIMARLRALDRPLLVHGPGGMGKTVMMQQLRDSAPAGCEVILFDCFGGGAYRRSEDERHRLDRGLLHIVNLMAFKGLCDPLLPGQTDDGMLLRAAAKRLEEASTTLQEISPGTLLVLLLDGVDNAAQQALDRGEKAFPTELLAIARDGRLPSHMRLVLTCRTERRHLLGKNLRVDEVAMQPFTRQETDQYLRVALPGAQPNDTDIALARSDGNPRVLSYLTQNWHEVLHSPRRENVVTVEQLIQERINQALDLSHDPDYLEPFLAGLAVLPVPIPVADYAAAHGITPEEARSLFVDLRPLLEETPLGVIFRDEPTETWIRKTYASKSNALKELALRLGGLQATSRYAAVALPHLLVVLRDVDQAVELALNGSLPRDLLGDIGGRRVKIARVRAALGLAIDRASPSVIVRLLVEAGTLQHADEKGSRYIAAHPNLSAILGDSDMLLQLYRCRTGDPALRHARLTIAHLLAGAKENAAQHAKYAREWLHLYQGKDTSRSDTQFVVVAVAFYLLCQRDFNAFFTWIARLSPPDAFAITVRVLSLAKALPAPGIRLEVVAALRDAGISSPGLLAGVLDALPDLPHDDEAALLDQLANGVTAAPRGLKLSILDADPILDAALRAYRLGELETCRTLRNASQIELPEVSAFDQGSHGQDLPSWLLYAMLGALLAGRRPSLMDILPPPFRKIAQQLPAPTVEDVAARVTSESGASQEELERGTRMVQTLRARIAPMMSLTAMCAAVLSAPAGYDDKAVAALIAASAIMRDDSIVDESELPSSSDIDSLARKLCFRILRTSQRFSATNAEAFARSVRSRSHKGAYEIIDHVEYFAAKPDTQEVAGEMVVHCVASIAQMRDLSWQRDAYASLALAILPASLHESRSLFSMGLALVDDVDETDSGLLSRVFALAQQANPSALNLARASRFVSLCESCAFDYHANQFPWLRFGKAAAATLGHRALVLTGRWDSRYNTGLSCSLAPLLVGLLQQQVLDAVQALALLLLETPEHWKNLRLDWTERREGLDIGIFDALVARGDLKPGEIIEELTQRLELDLASKKELPAFVLRALLNAALAHPGEAGMSRERLTALWHARNAALADHEGSVGDETGSDPANSKQDQERRLLAEVIATTDPCDGSSIEAALMRLEDASVFQSSQLLFEGLHAKVNYGQRFDHVQALSEVCAPWSELDALLAALHLCLDAWSTMTSLKDLRPTLASKLVSANLPALVGEPYSLEEVLGKLAALGPSPAGDVARDVVAAACERRADVAPATWLALGATLSQELDTKDISEVVNRLFDSPIAHLAERGAVGKHQDWLASEGDVDDCIADLIWLRLGHQDPSRRAAATDAMVFLVKHRRSALLEKLVARWNSRDAATVGSVQGEFHFLDARLSLAIGLLRSLHSTPDPSLGAVLQDMLGTHPHHPLLRLLAEQASAVLGNAPPAPPAIAAPFPWEAVPGSEAALAAEPDDEPASLPRLARMFSLAPDVVATRAGANMMQWGATLQNVDTEQPQPEDKAESTQYRSPWPERAFLAHLRWHAMLTAGGELVDAYRASPRHFDEQAWTAFVQDAWDVLGIQWS